MAEGVDKVVLAYSGGLDTSVILRWLQDRYGCDVVTFTEWPGPTRYRWSRSMGTDGRRSVVKNPRLRLARD